MVRARVVPHLRRGADVGGVVGAVHRVRGVGVSALPVDLVKAFLGRPRTVIPKSEYIKIAGKIAEHTQAVIAEAREVQREERGTEARLDAPEPRRALAD